MHRCGGGGGYARRARGRVGDGLTGGEGGGHGGGVAGRIGDTEGQCVGRRRRDTRRVCRGGGVAWG
jgi:hypothetical protein